MTGGEIKMEVRFCDEKKEFKPVCITIDTLKELQCLLQCLYVADIVGSSSLWSELDDFFGDNNLEEG